MTINVKKRLRILAEAESIYQHPEFTIPYTKLEEIVYSDLFKVMFGLPFFMAVFFGSIWYLGPPFFLLVWAALIGGGLKFYSVLGNQRKSRLAGPLRQWNDQVEVRVGQLARERSQKIEDRKSFYQSAEWGAARNSAIAMQGRKCRNCLKSIIDKSDLTVDHIKPISKYPNLRLTPSNLQVLCRSCNSSKGNR